MVFAFIFDSVGGAEWLVLLGVVLIVAGPRELPSMVRRLGRMMAHVRRLSDEFKRQLMSLDEPPPPPNADGHAGGERT